MSFKSIQMVMKSAFKYSITRNFFLFLNFNIRPSDVCFINMKFEYGNSFIQLVNYMKLFFLFIQNLLENFKWYNCFIIYHFEFIIIANLTIFQMKKKTYYLFLLYMVIINYGQIVRAAKKSHCLSYVIFIYFVWKGKANSIYYLKFVTSMLEMPYIFEVWCYRGKEI